MSNPHHMMNEDVSKRRFQDILIYFVLVGMGLRGVQGVIKVELVDGSTANEGRVEIVRDGVRGTVCDGHWDDMDAAVICRMLGYNYGGTGHTAAADGEGTGTIWLDNVECNGDEATIEACTKTDWGQVNCQHDRDVGVTCHLASYQNTSITVELVNGTHRHEGRVEIVRNGVRGTVCDDDWDKENAAVICRMIGYNYGGLAYKEATYGNGSGDILLDDVRCVGNETTIDDCDANEWGYNNCHHTEDAGVKCNLGSSNTTENIAFQKATIMSSTFQFEDSHYAVDGNLGVILLEDHCSHTDMYDNSPWWMVDLQGTFLVRSVALTNRWDAFWERLHSFVIEIFAHDALQCSNSTAHVCVNYSGEALERGETRTFECQTPVSGRVVRIRKWKVDAYDDILTLCEVQIFGDVVCQTRRSFYSHPNTRRISQQLVMMAVAKPVECALECEKKKSCLGFNFNVNTNECELICSVFNGTIAIQPAWSYYGHDVC